MLRMCSIWRRPRIRMRSRQSVLTYPALGVRVRVRRLDRGVEHDRVLAPEDLVEGAAELAVAVVDQEPRLLVAALGYRAGQVARLLGHPGAGRIAGHGDALDGASFERDRKRARTAVA